MAQLVNDPNFNDPAAWDIWGPGVAITGGQHVCTSANSVLTVETVPTVAVVGGKYFVTVDCASADVTPITAKVTFAGVTAWDSTADGVGTHKKTITAATVDGLVITAGNGPSGYSGALNSVKVREMHARQIIREAAAGIVTGLTTTGANVFQSRVYNVQESELPCLLVYTVSEPGAEVQTITTPRRLVREVELIIEGKAKGATDMDDVLDDIAEEVETAISADNSLGIGAVDTIIAGTEIDYTSEGDQPIGSVIMRYAVTYIVNENAPGTLL